MEDNQKQSGAPNFNKLEQEVLKFWEENNIFQKSLEQSQNAISDPSAVPQDERHAPFIFYDGPPFATGLPHYGHILASTIKDAIPRYQTMKGHFVRRRWGWDCHGLPIENIVEQKLKISGKKQIEELGVDKFNQACRENVLRFVEEWGKMVKRMGRWIDFDNSYKTMDTSYMESVWWALSEIWKKQLIYEDRKVLLYCSRCETPISNFEVAMDNSYKEINEQSVYAKFKLQKGQRIINDLTNDRTYILAWTTTPWTLPANSALSLGPEITYILVEQNKERYILAKDRLLILEGEYEIVNEFPARALEGLAYEPIYMGVVSNDNKRAHRLYLADFVTTTDGTGVVHSAPIYGEDDYNLAKQKDLPKQEILNQQGKFLTGPNIPETLLGVFFKDADKIIVKELQGLGKVYKVENYLHSYPHCYRCGTPLFYNALPAWFINIQKVKADLLKNNEAVNWYPEHLKEGRFRQGIENAPDWNISRNRFWATPLPFWKCENQDCRSVICIGSIEELKNKSSNFSEIYTNPEIDLHRPYIDGVKLKCEKCGSVMSRVPEVVDCWVESASMPFAELHFPFENKELFEARFPADFVAEYIAQTRAWFYVMHVLSTIIHNRAPFKNVVTTGNILAEDGSKMSKSKNNYPDPWILIEKYGIDAIRFYLLTTPVMNGDDLNFSEKGVMEIGRKVNALIYNVWSFYRMYEKEVNSKQFTVNSVENVLDKWVVARLQQTHKSVTEDLDAYNTVKAGKEIVDFVNDLSTWYLRRSRDRIKLGGDQAKAALDVLAYVLVELSKLLAPFMPFLSEFIYRDVTGKESVHLESWSVMDAADENQTAKMETVRELASLGLAIRKEKSMPVRQPLANFAFELSEEGATLEAEYSRLVLEELNVKMLDDSLKDANLRPEGVVITAGTKLVKNFYLDLNLTEELKLEGLVRELERQVQDLRKKSGLKVGELVDLYYNTQDEAIESILLSSLDRKKTFVSQITKSLEVEVDFESQAEVGGKAIWLGVIKT